MALRELLLKLGVDVDKRDVDKANNAVKTLKRAAIATAAAFAAIKVGKFLAGTVEGVRAMGDELDKTSKQLGLTVAALQELRFAAGLAGVSATEMSTSLRFLQRNAFEAARGSKSIADAFAKAGVSVRDANGELKSGDQLITELAEGLGTMENSTQKVAIAQTLMGRSGAKLLPLFEGGAEGLAKMRKEAQQLGGVMSQELVDASVELTDDQFRLQQAWQGLKNELSIAVMPTMLRVTRAFIEFAKAAKGPVKFAIEIFANVIGGVMRLFKSLNAAVDGLGTALAAMVPILAALGVAMFIFGKASVAAALKAAAAWALAALPWLFMAVLVAALFAIVEDFFTFLEGGDSIIGRLIDSFRRWFEDSGGAVKAFAGLFADMVQQLFGLTDGVTAFIKKDFELAFEAVGRMFDDLVQAAQMASDFIVEAIDKPLEKARELAAAVTDALGITNEGETIAAAERIDVRRERASARALQFRKRELAFFRQLQKEGLGTVTSTAVGAVFTPAVGREREANQRLQEVNSQQSISVNVDARGATNPNAVGDSVANKIASNTQIRQASQAFQAAR